MRRHQHNSFIQGNKLQSEIFKTFVNLQRLCVRSILKLKPEKCTFEGRTCKNRTLRREAKNYVSIFIRDRNARRQNILKTSMSIYEQLSRKERLENWDALKIQKHPRFERRPRPVAKTA